MKTIILYTTDPIDTFSANAGKKVTVVDSETAEVYDGILNLRWSRYNYVDILINNEFIGMVPSK